MTVGGNAGGACARANSQDTWELEVVCFTILKNLGKLTSVIVLMLFIGAGLVSYRSLALMRSLERLLDGDFRGFLFWCLSECVLVILAQLI